jgi:hypothetical protein
MTPPPCLLLLLQIYLRILALFCQNGSEELSEQSGEEHFSTKRAVAPRPDNEQKNHPHAIIYHETLISGRFPATQDVTW